MAKEMILLTETSTKFKTNCSLVLLTMLSTFASAQGTQTQQDDSHWWIRAGAAWVSFNATADLKAGGQPIPGGNADVKNNAAFLAELGYRFTPSISLGLTVGVPPRLQQR
ncbi:porin family protein [Cupriavidus campinensis]|uniref:hypothetical protein n=1 Tax=Cupriavidus campinensis TaxID=151783 RepID=UPI0011ED1D17|nr:hypothetical protein [Cupriavidus campinensis]